MSFVTTLVASVIAEESRPTDGPWWIPLATAAAGLLGTLVGGLITYYTTTVANRLAEEAEQEQQRVALVRDVSIRFIQAVSKQSIESMKLKDLSAGITDALKKAAQLATQGGDPQEVVAAFQRAGLNVGNASQGNKTAPLEMAATMFESLGGAQAGLSETSVLLAEMRLLLPSRIVTIAAMVTAMNVLQQLTAALPAGVKVEPGHVNQVMNMFTNAVRAEMGLDRYDPPEDFKLQDFPQRIKDLEAEMQAESAKASERKTRSRWAGVFPAQRSTNP